MFFFIPLFVSRHKITEIFSTVGQMSTAATKKTVHTTTRSEKDLVKCVSGLNVIRKNVIFPRYVFCVCRFSPKIKLPEAIRNLVRSKKKTSRECIKTLRCSLAFMRVLILRICYHFGFYLFTTDVG